MILSQEIQALLDIAPGIQDPFFIVDGKAEAGSLADAQNQACRGGATLINAARLLQDMMKAPDVKGADARTLVFSATMSPGLVQIWVHWAEVLTSGVRFHMNHVASRSLDEPDQVVQCRIIIHNILEWGVNTRRPALSLFHDQLNQHQRRQTKKEVQEYQETKERGKRKRKTNSEAPKSQSSKTSLLGGNG